MSVGRLADVRDRHPSKRRSGRRYTRKLTRKQGRRGRGSSGVETKACDLDRVPPYMKGVVSSGVSEGRAARTAGSPPRGGGVGVSCVFAGANGGRRRTRAQFEGQGCRAARAPELRERSRWCAAIGRAGFTDGRGAQVRRRAVMPRPVLLRGLFYSLDAFYRVMAVVTVRGIGHRRRMMSGWRGLTVRRHFIRPTRVVGFDRLDRLNRLDGFSRLGRLSEFREVDVTRAVGAAPGPRAGTLTAGHRAVVCGGDGLRRRGARQHRERQHHRQECPSDACSCARRCS